MAKEKENSTEQVDIELNYAALDRPFQDVEFLCEYLASQRSANFFKNFVILPRNLKSRGARFASYSSRLRDMMAQILGGNAQKGSLDDVVTQSNLFPDHSGWLVEQTSGRRRWCVIADMLLCVFETRQSEKPMKVIMLPGHKVKAMMFSSAKQDTLVKSTCTYEERSEEQLLTISGVQKHQFAIYSPDSGERFMFGADSKETIDKWVAMVTVATNLTQELFTDSDEDSGYIPSSFGGKRESSHSRESSPTNSSNEPKTKHNHSVTDTSEPILSTREPLKSRNSDSNIQESDDKLAFSKVKRTTSFGSHNDLATNDKKKLKSGKLSQRRMVRTKSWNMGSQESLCSNGSVCSTDSKQSTESLSKFKALWSRNAVKTIDLNGKDNPDLSDTSSKSATRSLEERIKSIPLPASISAAMLTRRASADSLNAVPKKSRSKSPTGSFRMRMFGAKYRDTHESTVLGDHANDGVKISGWLQYKQLLKWSKLFCVVSKSYFYGYRSDYPSETPDVVLPLCECSVHSMDSDKQRKHCFKVCHLNAKSTYLAASDNSEFGAWISVLKQETKGWKDSCALLKSQSSIDSLISSISKSSMDSFNSNSSIGSFDSCTQSFSGVEPNTDKTTNVANDGCEDDATDGFGFIVGEKRMKTSRWQPPCPAHGLDTSSSSLNSSGLLYESSMRRNSSFSPSVSSGDCSMEVLEPSEISLSSPGPVNNVPKSPSAAESDRTSVTSSCSCVCSSTSECVCDSIRDETLSHYVTSLPTKYTSPAKYDANLKQIWKNDRNYQLQLLKSRVSALPDKPEIFNVHLPGPNNEGLLLVNDEAPENSHSSVKHGKAVSHKVYPSEKGKTTIIEKCGSEVVVAIPAREVSNPTISGYLDRQLPNGSWKSCWYILKDSTLYRYNAPIDGMTETVLQLPGYTVECSQVKPNTFIVSLEHQDFEREVLRTHNEAECTSWKEQLEAATHKHCIPRDENDNTHKISEVSDEVSKNDMSKEIVQVKKEELLRELLQQKQDIEKKRAHNGSGSVSSMDNLQVPETDSVSTLQPDNVFKQLTYLKQRKFSTQLKVQSLQKQLQQLQDKRKEQKTFKFGRRAASVKVESRAVSQETLERKHSGQGVHSGADESPIQQQLQNLTSELHTLDEHLDKMQKSAAVTMGLTTPELLTSLEKRRQLSRKKMSDSQKSTDSSSSEGDQCNDSVQTMDRKISKSSVLKLHRPNISGAFFKKTSGEKKSSNSQSKDSNKNACLADKRRPSWERPWRNSWDATKSPLRNINEDIITRSASTLNDIPQDRLVHCNTDTKWKSKSYKVLPTQSAPTSQTKESDVDETTNSNHQQNLHQNIQPTRNEINPAALAEIAAFEELIREKMGSS